MRACCCVDMVTEAAACGMRLRSKLCRWVL